MLRLRVGVRVRVRVTARARVRGGVRLRGEAVGDEVPACLGIGSGLGSSLALALG